jgi:hypothetical protein
MYITQISVFLENKKGRLAELTALMAHEGINIKALSLADTSDFGVLRIIVTIPAKCVEIVKKGGFIVRQTPVIAVEVEDRPGGMQRVLETLDRGGINVEYMYATNERTQHNAIVIFKIDDHQKALEVLKAAGIHTISSKTLENTLS